MLRVKRCAHALIRKLFAVTAVMAAASQPQLFLRRFRLPGPRGVVALDEDARGWCDFFCDQGGRNPTG